jgi:hypothetical protein
MHNFRIALGSAREVDTHLRLLVGGRSINARRAEEAFATLRRRPRHDLAPPPLQSLILSTGALPAGVPSLTFSHRSTQTFRCALRKASRGATPSQVDVHRLPKGGCRPPASHRHGCSHLRPPSRSHADGATLGRLPAGGGSRRPVIRVWNRVRVRDRGRDRTRDRGRHRGRICTRRAGASGAPSIAESRRRSSVPRHGGRPP